MVEQVDRARGDVPRNVWLRRAVERALAGRYEASSPEPVSSAPAEQPRASVSAKVREALPDGLGRALDETPAGSSSTVEIRRAGLRPARSYVRQHSETCTCASCRPPK